MKQCKNCQLWRPYKGQEPTMPRRSSHACMLRLREREVIDPDTREQKKILVPSLAIDMPKGPRWGERTHPKDGCQYFVGKPKPFIKPFSVKPKESPVSDQTDGDHI